MPDTQPATDRPATYRAACHCGAVKFLVTPPEGLKVNRCNCSICRIRGAVVVWTWLDGVQILEGRDKLSCYRFKTHSAEHYFCSVCGVYTHHRQRANTERYSVNVACIEGVSPFDFTDIPVWNGRDHSKDVTGPRLDIVGHVSYTSYEEDDGQAGSR